MEAPNLFRHARSELSQDAVLAYIIEWANPRYQIDHPELNAIGESLLRELFGSSAKESGFRCLQKFERITELTVETQTNSIDILVLVNHTFAIIIEDKVNTHEHSGQIERYKNLLASRPSPTGDAWVIHAVYVKTGNESPHRRPVPGSCGVLMRPDLLTILDRFPNVANQIIQEFRQHLRHMQAETESFRTRPYSEWSVRAREGFYGAVVDWLSGLHAAGELAENPLPQWSYQPNPSGGEWVCAWYWTPLDQTTQMWLQLVDADRMQLRIANYPRAGSKPKVEPRQLHDMLQRLTRATAIEPWKDRIWVRKAGRFGGGDSAAVVVMMFQPNAVGWLPQNAEGNLDWPAVCERLRLAMRFVDHLRSAPDVTGCL